MTKDRAANLTTEDKALLKAAATGEGSVPLTPERAAQISNIIRERSADIAARYPGLVAASDYETRLAIVAWAFEHIIAHATEGGTFRYLIYDRLGFKGDAYLPLYNAGGMTISNEFDLSPKDPAA